MAIKYVNKELIRMKRMAKGYISWEDIDALPTVEMSVTPKQRLCKDCKWWKDSDGVYRRDIGMCPINSKKVFEGNGFCYLFEPKEGESE